MRNVQSISITIPTSLVKMIENIQKEELKSCSAIVTEALRQYTELNQYQKLQKEISRIAAGKGFFTEEDIDKAVHGARNAET